MSAKKTHEAFVLELAKKNPTVEVLGQYSSSKNPVLCKCKICGYKWNGDPGNLLNGHICRQCARKISAEKRHLIAVAKNNFATNFPHLLDEWDYEGNGTNRPEDFSVGCDFLAQWICPLGHHYSAKISERTKKKPLNCPICHARHQTSFPEQAILFYVREHFPSALNRYKQGFGRQELDIYIPSLKYGIEYDGGAWHKNSLELEIKKYKKCQDLGITLIRIKETVPSKSSPQTYDKLLTSEYRSKSFLGLDNAIGKLFEFLNISSDINTKRDCLLIKKAYYTELKCNSLAELYPSIAEEWDYEANGGLKPEMFFPGSQDYVHWICRKGHSYRAKIADRVYGHGCSKCVGLRKKTTEEFKAEMLIVNPDILILGEYKNSKTAILCQCKKCNYQWTPTPNCLLRGSNCPNCANRKRSIYKSEYHARQRHQK